MQPIGKQEFIWAYVSRGIRYGEESLSTGGK